VALKYISPGLSWDVIFVFLSREKFILNFPRKGLRESSFVSFGRVAVI
jgi:hypothetical protein